MRGRGGRQRGSRSWGALTPKGNKVDHLGRVLLLDLREVVLDEVRQKLHHYLQEGFVELVHVAGEKGGEVGRDFRVEWSDFAAVFCEKAEGLEG